MAQNLRPLAFRSSRKRTEESIPAVPKVKMLNFFKNLFGSGSTENHATGNGHGYPPPLTSATAHSQPVYVEEIPEASAPAPQPPPVPQHFSAPRPQPNGNVVQIPLYAIIAVLPLELKTRIKQTLVSEIFVTLTVDRVLEQLAGGSVKITFGELRELAPKVFTLQADRDQVEISLPLHEILPQINPALLPRRNQRQVQIPEDVHGPFGNDFAGVRFADTRTITGTPVAPPRETKMPAAPAPRPPQPTPPAQAMPPAQPIQPARPIPLAPTAKLTPPTPPIKFAPPAPPVKYTPPAPPAPTVNNTPAPVIPFRGSISSTPTPPAPTANPSPVPPVRPVFPPARGVGAVPLPTATPRMPSAPSNGNGNGNGNGHASIPRMPVTPPPAPEPLLSAPLAALSDSWPEVLRSEIEQLNLSEAHVALPVRVVEPALKQGKIAFPWKMIRSWIRPATLPTVSAHDGMMLDLPLRVVAPLFIARQKQGNHPQQKVQVDENIPNLFFGFPQPETPAPVVEPPPVRPPTPAPAPVAAPQEEPIGDVFIQTPKAGGIPDTNFYVWGDDGEAPQMDETEFKKKVSPGTDFTTRFATPNEVVTRATALDGVVGALVALPDGLMVASKLPPDLNGDTLAAFLPHIFGKVSACTKELRMGELNNLNFTVGNVPWKIFRVNAIFFAAFGSAGKPLPTGQLSILAGELNRKK
jgi:predicted regulator of Ras-like GTPase activity (Roadblock/LC7/MglB family)